MFACLLFVYERLSYYSTLPLIGQRRLERAGVAHIAAKPVMQSQGGGRPIDRRLKREEEDVMKRMLGLPDCQYKLHRSRPDIKRVFTPSLVRAAIWCLHKCLHFASCRRDLVFSFGSGNRQCRLNRRAAVRTERPAPNYAIAISGGMKTPGGKSCPENLYFKQAFRVISRDTMKALIFPGSNQPLQAVFFLVAKNIITALYIVERSFMGT